MDRLMKIHEEHPDIVDWEEEIEDAEDMLSEEFWKEQWYVKYITWPIGTAYRWLRELPYRVKYYRQRGQRCWSDQDAWAIDYWLIEGLIPMIERLKDNKLGVPASMYRVEDGVDVDLNPTDEADRLAEQRWDNKLGEIIYGLKCAKKLQDGGVIYDDKGLSKRLAKSSERSFVLIGKHLFNLWD